LLDPQALTLDPWARMVHDPKAMPLELGTLKSSNTARGNEAL
jgi:hypothetical protein